MVLQIADALLEDIRKCCMGQLRPVVYREIYNAALQASEGDFVEIGTAHGAATVVLARALKDSGRPGHVYTIGKPGEGSHIGDPAALQAAFRKFDVADLITAHFAEASAIRELLPKDQIISVLLLDADGRIDRDFANLYDKVAPGGPIIIDDYAEHVHLKLGHGGRAIGIGLKYKLTYVLVEHFRDAGYIDQFRTVYDTLFCAKALNAPAFRMDSDQRLDLYSALLFTWQRIDKRLVRVFAASARDELASKLAFRGYRPSPSASPGAGRRRS